MARHVDPPDGELSKAVNTQTPPTSPDHTDEGSSESPNAKSIETDEASAAQADADKETSADEAESQDAAPARRPVSHLRLTALVLLVMVVALGGLAGWLGFRAYQSYQAEQQRELFVQVARQGAFNLTTIDWQHADADVQRILDSATGSFYDDFAARAQPFIDVVKKVQSKSVGTVTEAGLESVSGDEAQVLVALSVKTSMPNTSELPPRFWRMRISVQKVGDDQVKVSNVSFVP